MAAKKKSPKPTASSARNKTDQRAYDRKKAIADAKARRNKPKKNTKKADSAAVRGGSTGSQSTRKTKRK